MCVFKKQTFSQVVFVFFFSVYWKSRRYSPMTLSRTPVLCCHTSICYLFFFVARFFSISNSTLLFEQSSHLLSRVGKPNLLTFLLVVFLFLFFSFSLPLLNGWALVVCFRFAFLLSFGFIFLHTPAWLTSCVSFFSLFFYYFFFCGFQPGLVVLNMLTIVLQ